MITSAASDLPGSLRRDNPEERRSDLYGVSCSADVVLVSIYNCILLCAGRWRQQRARVGASLGDRGDYNVHAWSRHPPEGLIILVISVNGASCSADVVLVSLYIYYRVPDGGSYQRRLQSSLSPLRRLVQRRRRLGEHAEGEGRAQLRRGRRASDHSTSLVPV